MIHKLLDSCLGPVVAAEQRLRRRRLAIGLLVAGALGCGLLGALALFAGWWSWPSVFGLLGALCLAGAVGYVRLDRAAPDLREIARRIEDGHPDLRAALLTAMDQRTGPGGELGFLQRRLLGEISEHALQNRWVRRVAEKRLAAAAWGQFFALVAFGFSLWFLLGQAPVGFVRGGTAGTPAPPDAATEIGPRIAPGDVELEKGARLVVEATFSGRAPAAATLVHRHAGGETRLPMQIGLDEGAFSALIPKVDTDGSYLVLHEETASDEFSIAVFEYPELLQADAVVTPPAYLGEERKSLADTRKITVMEGSAVEWRLRVNKPVAAAELFGEDGQILTLAPDPADATLLLASHTPEKTQRYRVHLVDEKDRANRRPPWLAVNVQENAPPQLKLTFPGRDFEVSALQELPLEAEVWDDVEVLRAGMTYGFRGEETEIVLADAPLAGEAKHSLATFIDIESLGARERDLVSYHFWAEDRDKDGQVRRSASDQFFAEVRLFEEIVREGAASGGMPGSQSGSEVGELIRLQKDILNASWKLVREHRGGKPFDALAEDVGVVGESQNVVLGKLEEALGSVEDAEMRAAMEQAKAHMRRAAGEFAEVSSRQDGELLPVAMESAREAYAELLKARARETEITRSRDASAGGQSSQERQRNLNLELEQKELKYEEQSVAATPAQTAEQQENLAVLNRLKDLARRQEAIAEKIKDLENQLRGADEQEKAEIERQLKRLQEEQRELLREVDDLAERMDSEQNRADMAEERERLGETRESVRETAERLESGQLSEAANAATRAGDQLEQMKEEFRERTSRQFANEVSGLRDSARELAQRQEAIGEQLQALAEAPAESSLSADSQSRRAEFIRSVAEQGRQLAEVLEAMRTLSEQAEPTEPLLSNSLYEAVRDAATNQVEESLEEAGELAFYNRATQALAAEEAAARGIEELKERVEKAAETILGNESDALRLARGELDKLIEEAKAEAERLAGEEGAEEGRAGGPTGSNEGQAPGGEEGEGKLADGGKAKGEGEGREAGGGQGQGDEEAGERSAESLAERGKGKGEGQGDEASESSPADGQAESAKAKGQEREGSQGQGQGGPPVGEPAEDGRDRRQDDGRQLASGGAREGGGALNLGGDGRHERLPAAGVSPGPLFFDDVSEERRPGPITGEDYEQWSDRLGNLEEMLPQEDLRNAVARIRDEARAMRIDYRRDDLPPGAATIDRRITEPLVELRQRIGEELAKLNRENPVAPIDRDPVPSEFRDLVRRYYEELGAGN